jgi:hypothetical protein
MLHKTAIVLLFLVAAVTLAWTQSEQPDQRPAPALVSPLLTPPSATQDAAGGAELPFSEPFSPPGIVTGDRPPLTFTSEAGRSNFFTGSLQVVAGYDDNALSVSSSRVSDLSYLMGPGIEVAQTRERWNWMLGYHPGFTINQRFNERNQSAHNLNLDATYRVTPHVALRLRDTFEKTTNLFSESLASPLASGFGSLQPGNRSVITPLAEQTGNASGVDLAYQFSAGSMVGAGGTYYFVNYGAVAGATGPSAGLIDVRSLGTNGFYAHRFANKHLLGTTYNFERLNFDLGNRIEIHRVLLFYSLPFHTHMTLSLWAGPEYHTTQMATINPAILIAPGSRWSGAGGASYNWQGQRTSFRAEYTRAISDGGGLMQAVTLQQATADVRRQLAARWTTSIGISYANNNPLDSILSTTGKIRVLSANVGLDHPITENVILGVQYGRDQQQYTAATPLLGKVNRNRVFFSLSYLFTRPLGR